MSKKYVFALLFTVAAFAQDHSHPRNVHGVPGGVPEFCAAPTVTSTGSGNWSSAATWSTKKVPGTGDRVMVAAGHNVLYDTASDAKVTCIELRGHLRFATDKSTRLKTNNIMVQDEGYLEIGSAANPIPDGVTAEVIIADQQIDRKIDPA